MTTVNNIFGKNWVKKIRIIFMLLLHMVFINFSKFYNFIQ